MLAILRVAQAKRSQATPVTSLEEVVRPFRELDNRVNIACIIKEYVSLAAVLTPTLWFAIHRVELGFGWGWFVAVVGVAIVLVGAIQHRLAGLGHEAAHFTLFRNRLANELISDLLCMFPIFATTHQYRLVHMAHHQYPNDWERDPDLSTIGHSKFMNRFPMSRRRFIYNYFIRFFYPHVLFKYFWDVAKMSALGGAQSTHLGKRRLRIPIATLLGMLQLAGLIATMAWINRHGGGPLLIAAPVGFAAVGLACIGLLPDAAFFQSPMRCAYGARTTAAFRLAYNTLLASSLGWLRAVTGIHFGGYYLLLWVLPLFTSFAYFMLLRDVYQHANADTGRLTNTRVFYNDPFTKWAIWVYGMDMHVPHHLYPAVPHYRLEELHRELKRRSKSYAEKVVECHGTFANRSGHPTVLDVMQQT